MVTNYVKYPVLFTSPLRKQYVAAFVDHAFDKSVRGVFEEFKRGFFKVCDVDAVDMFQPEELKEVMVGHGNYDWPVFKQVCSLKTLGHIGPNCSESLM